MYIPLHCIALHTVKYSDRANIVTVYTREQGRRSLLVSAGASREARRCRAVMMPLGAFECVADIRFGRELSTVRDVRVSPVRPSLHSHPVKMAVAMFMAEFVGALLRESPSDEMMYDFVDSAAAALDRIDDPRALANFTLVFTYRMTRFMGIEPDVASYNKGSVFDMTDGVFRQSAPLHGRWLPSQEARIVRMLASAGWESGRHIALNRAMRRRALEVALDYYGWHFGSLAGLSSIHVLRELFD